jgi:hypothetical protein
MPRYLKGYAETFYIYQSVTQEPLESALILSHTKIRPRIEVLAFPKQAQSSH